MNQSNQSNQSQIDKLAGLSGSGSSDRAPKLDVSFLSFQGNTGEFSVYEKDSTEKGVRRPISSPVSVVLLKKRRVLKSGMDGPADFWSNEHNSVNDKIIVTKKVNNTLSTDGVGYAPVLKEKNPFLKTVEVLYVIHEGVTKKLEVKGGSLIELYDYLSSLSKEGLHIFQVETILGATDKMNDKGKKYKAITFTKGSVQEDFGLIESELTKVSRFTNESDAYWADKISKIQPAAAISGVSIVGPANVSVSKPQPDFQKDINNFNGVAYPTEEINPDAIPF